MRELANDSARSAITRSVKLQTRNTQIHAISKFIAAGVALLCGLAAFAFVAGFLKYIVAIATLVIVGVFVHEGLGLLRDAKRRLLLAESGQLASGQAAV